jgi:hypothetical protein
MTSQSGGAVAAGPAAPGGAHPAMLTQPSELESSGNRAVGAGVNVLRVNGHVPETEVIGGGGRSKGAESGRASAARRVTKGL